MDCLVQTEFLEPKEIRARRVRLEKEEGQELRGCVEHQENLESQEIKGKRVFLVTTVHLDEQEIRGHTGPLVALVYKELLE